MSEDTKATIDILESYWKKGGFYEIPVEVINVVEAELEDKDKEIERLNNIIKRLEEFIEKEIELYTLELTEKNTNALSYSLPIRGVYKEIYNVLQKLKGSDK